MKAIVVLLSFTVGLHYFTPICDAKNTPDRIDLGKNIHEGEPEPDNNVLKPDEEDDQRLRARKVERNLTMDVEDAQEDKESAARRKRLKLGDDSIPKGIWNYATDPDRNQTRKQRNAPDPSANLKFGKDTSDQTLRIGIDIERTIGSSRDNEDRKSGQKKEDSRKDDITMRAGADFIEDSWRHALDTGLPDARVNEFAQWDDERKHAEERRAELSDLTSDVPPVGDWAPNKADRTNNGGFGDLPDLGSPVPYKLNGHINIDRGFPWAMKD